MKTGRCKKGHLRPSGQKEITKIDTPKCVVKKTDVIVITVALDLKILLLT
jgi:hypothetical protein